MTIIPKFQEGGGWSLPFVDYAPFTGFSAGATADGSSTTTTTSSSKSGSSSDSEEDKGVYKILDLIKELDGLPTDIQDTAATIKQLYTRASLRKGIDGKIDSDDLVKTYLAALQKVHIAKFNKSEYDNAKTICKDNDGLNQEAIDAYGRIYVLNNKSGQIVAMSVEDYFQKHDLFSPLTNANLLNYRANNPQFKFNNSPLEIVANGIGQKGVTEIIQKALSDVKESTVEESGYVKEATNDITKGIQLLRSAAKEGVLNGPDALYKLSITHSDNEDLILSAMDYLWNAMPENAKTWLKLRGGDIEDPDDGAKQLMLKLAFSKRAPVQKVDWEPQKNPATKKEDGEDGYKDTSNPYFNMAKMIGGVPTEITINSGSNYQLKVDGVNYSSIPNLDGEPIHTSSVNEFLNQGPAGIVTDRNAIKFGDKLLTPDQLNNIMYDGSGGTMAILPTKQENGHTVINTDILDDYLLAMQDVNDIPVSIRGKEKLKKIGQILEKYKLNGLLDLNGLPNKDRFGQFLLIDAVAVNKDEFLGPDGSNWMELVQKPGDDYVKRVEAALSTNSNKDNYKIESHIFGIHSDELYRGTLYIPITNNELQMITAFDQHSKQPYKLEQDYQTYLKRTKAKTASSDVL